MFPPDMDPVGTLTLEQYRQISDDDRRDLLQEEYGDVGIGTDPLIAETPNLRS